jgi:hypothetical protein
MIFMIVYAIAVLVGVYGAVDAAVRPWDHWQRMGGNKAAWIFVQLLVFVPLAGLAGLAAAIMYLTTVRPKLKVAAAELPIP